MHVFLWTDRQPSRSPRALLQRGQCSDGHCEQFSVSISNGDIGMTVRFESEQEFRRFLDHGELMTQERPGDP